MRAIVLLLAAVLASGFAVAQVPRAINYQGVLTNAAGIPLTSPPAVAMTFALFNVASGGAALWKESQSVSVTNGVFDVTLGAGTLVGGVQLGNLAFDVPYFLEGAAGGETLAPRSALSSSPYAIHAASADGLATGATIPGSQITGSITTATIPVAQVTGAVSGNGAAFMYNGVSSDLDQLSPQGSTHNTGANALQSQSPMPFACTAGNFFVSAPKGPTVITTYTLLKGGLSTGITCTIPVTIGSTSCNDLVNTASFNLGDKASTLVSGGAGAGATVAISWRCK